MPRVLPLSYCAEFIRTHDKERYLCTLFVPEPMRKAWFALFAFDNEIALIAGKVSEEIIGHIRFAWWREALDEIYAGSLIRKHPVVEALAETIHAHQLPRAPFDTMLEARAADLQKEPFSSFTEMESYCQSTSSALFELCGVVARIPKSPALDSLGIAWALTSLARTKPDFITQSELLDVASEHLEKATLENYFKPFVISCDFILKRLRKNKNLRSPLLLPLTLWWKMQD